MNILKLFKNLKFKDYISLNTHYKPGEKFNDSECPDLVFDDNLPYKNLVKIAETTMMNVYTVGDGGPKVLIMSGFGVQSLTKNYLLHHQRQQLMLWLIFLKQVHSLNIFGLVS